VRSVISENGTHPVILENGSALRNAEIFIIPEKGTEQIPALLIRRWSARNTSAVNALGILMWLRREWRRWHE
jgi:hypothetical protein